MNIRIRKFEKAVVFAVLFATLACLSIGTASAATHEVYQGDSIQRAIYNATAGDTIIVHDGTYNESISVDKQLTIQSENGADSTFIHAVGEYGYGCRIHTDHVNIIGFTIEEASDACGIIIIEAKNCNISNNNVSGNYQGIYLLNSSRNTIYKNDVLANEQWGISLNYSSSYNQISHNNVLNTWNGNGIGVMNSSDDNTIAHNTAMYNRYNGIYFTESNDNKITDNDVSSNYLGISLSTSNNNEVRNNVANTNQGTGIALRSSNENIIEANKANTNTYMGIHLEKSLNNNIRDNNASNNDRDGIYLWNYSSSNTISDNAISNNNWSGIVLSSSSNNTISGNDAGSNNEDGVALIYSSNNAISDNTISNNKKGIDLEASSNNTISSNTISNNRDGISLLDSSNNAISGNTFANDGLVVYSSYKNVVKDNTVNGKLLVYLEETSDIKVTNAGQVILVNCTNITVENLDLANTNVGVELWGTEDSLISNNNVINNYCGISLGNSINNLITGNNVSSNYQGIALIYSNNNQICFNNFIDNTGDIYSGGSNNIWNTTRLILYTYNSKQYTNYIGNYWSDYTGSDTDNDGIGDTSYSIDSGKDYSPLMQPCENYTLLAYPVFDTSAGTYPSIMGRHEGKIKPSYDVLVSYLYTYSCAGTGGHTKSIKIYENNKIKTSGTWNGYQEDWQNIALTPSVTLKAGKEYSYVIETGSYPQIIHESGYTNVTGGTISCDKFTAANGNEYTGWIPAIKLWS